MKLTIFLFVFLLPTLASAQIDTEPTNNVLTGADALVVGTANNASINPANDNDYFKFTITERGIVKITVSNVPANIDMDYEFFNEIGISVYSAGYEDGANFVVDGLLCNPGTYSFRLADNEGNPAQYTVRVDLDVTDIYECNNSLAEAKSIPLATNIYASIYDENDNDYYKFTITQPGVVKITVSNVPSNIDMDYEFFNELGISVYSAGYEDGANFVVDGLLCNPGTYAFRLADNEGNPAQYCVRVDLDVTDMYECNNSLPMATLIPLATNIYASIYDENDNDYYKFNITQPGVVKIIVSNVPANIDMDFEFFNELGISVGSAGYEDGANFIVDGLVCNSGMYAFRLTDNEGNPAQYCVRVDFDISDVYECNQEFNTAAPVTCNIPVFASINPAGDQDCYEITLTQPDIIIITVSNVPANLDLSVGLYGPAPSTDLIKQQNGNTGSTVSFSSPQTLPVGTYYLCITDNKANANQYKLSVSCPSLVGTTENQLAKIVNIYPNPTHEVLHLDLAGIFNLNDYKYEIRTLLGEITLYDEIKIPNETIPVNNLAEGLYIITVKSKDGSTSRAFMKI